MPSYYLPGLESQSVGSLVKLGGEEFHHLTRVTHRRTQDAIALNSGRGTVAKAVIKSIGKTELTLEITELHCQEPSAKPYAIAFALLKNKHDELIVEKCSELGAEAFFPLLTEFSIRQASDNTSQRFAKIALAAIKQCDNPWLPEIHPALSMEEALQAIEQKGYTPIVCSELRPDVWLYNLEQSALGKPCFLIGPEGGWSPEELSLLAPYPQICLGNLVTRAETAAIAVAAQWLAYANQLSTSGTM